MRLRGSGHLWEPSDWGWSGVGRTFENASETHAGCDSTSSGKVKSQSPAGLLCWDWRGASTWLTKPLSELGAVGGLIIALQLAFCVGYRSVPSPLYASVLLTDRRSLTSSLPPRGLTENGILSIFTHQMLHESLRTLLSQRHFISKC